MNSRAKKHIVIIFLTVFIIYSVMILTTFNLEDNHKKVSVNEVIDFASSLSHFLIIIGGIFSLVYYNFLYSKRKRQLFEQFTVNKLIHILVPIIGIYLALFLVDTLTVVLGEEMLIKDENYYQTNLIAAFYLKYLILPFAVVMMTFSRNFLKFIPLCAIAILAFVQLYGNSMSTSNTQFMGSYMILIYKICFILIIDIIVLYLAYKVEQIYKQNHSELFINAAYYLLGIIFFIIVFHDLFMTISPYNGGGTFVIGETAIYLGPYLVVFVILTVFVFITRQKLDMKRVLILFSPFVILTLTGVILMNIHNPYRVDCNLDKYKNEETSLSFENTFLIDDFSFGEKSFKYIKSKSNKCYYDYKRYATLFGSVNSKMNKDEVYIRREFYVGENNKSQLITLKNDKETIKGLYDNLDSFGEIPSFLVEKDEKKYVLVYIPSNMQKNKKEIVSKITGELEIDENKIMYIDFDLFYKIFISSIENYVTNYEISYSSLNYFVDGGENNTYKIEEYFRNNVVITDKIQEEIHNIIKEEAK